MKVMIISSNTLAAAPTGPAYIAGAALRAGHEVSVFECMFAEDLPRELSAEIKRFEPDAIGISIRLVHAFIIDAQAPYNTRHLDLRQRVGEVVRVIRQITTAPVILGGPGFNYYARDWLEYLNLDFGIRGEADFSFPLLLDRLERGESLAGIPGCVYRQDGIICKESRDTTVNLDDTALPAYQLFDLPRYEKAGISPGILTKRGCAFKCSYCMYRSLEGAAYRLKSAARVVDEIELIQRIHPARMTMFCENNFNTPRRHAEAICREIIRRGVSVRWGTGDLRPLGVTDDFCRLMRESGCGFVNLSIESGSEKMLKRMQRGYSMEDVEESLHCLERSGIPYSASIMIGAPGENPDTIQETLKLLDRYPIPEGTWMTVGVCLWTPRQEILAEARQAGQLPDDKMLFEGANYLSPELSRSYMEALIKRLRGKNGLSLQVNQPYAGFRWPMETLVN
jgi:radical SAM superfamily enzyme YgiQ (UPF0313 family)